MGRFRSQIRDDACASINVILVRSGRRQDRRGVEEPIWLRRRERGRPRLCDRRHERSRTNRRRALFPGFAKYQEVKADELATTVSNVDLGNCILSNFKTVDEVRLAMPKIRVVRN